MKLRWSPVLSTFVSHGDRLPVVRAADLASYADPPGAPPAPPAAPPAAAPPPPANPDFIPKARFDEVNGRMQAAEAKLAQYEPKIQQFDQVSAQLQAAAAARDLARVGIVTDDGTAIAQLLHSRQQNAPPLADWVRAELASPTGHPALRALIAPGAPPPAAPPAPPAAPPGTSPAVPPATPPPAPPAAPPGQFQPPAPPPPPGAAPPGEVITAGMIDAAYARYRQTGAAADLAAARALTARHAATLSR